MLLSAQEIAVCRSVTKTTSACHAFLDKVCESDLILLGMLADAGDECNVLLRREFAKLFCTMLFECLYLLWSCENKICCTMESRPLLFFYRTLDQNELDIAALPLEIQSFVHRIEGLFLHGDVCHCGYTKFMLTQLRTTERLVALPNQQFKRVGGFVSVTQEVIAENLRHMRAWVTLVIQALAAEFPSFEVCSSFEAFRLFPKPAAKKVASGLQKLAEIWGLDAAALICQYNDFVTFAQIEAARYERHAASDFNAWSESLGRVMGGWSRREHMKKHPCKELAFLLLRFGVLLNSGTSCCERDFSDYVRQ